MHWFEVRKLTEQMSNRLNGPGRLLKLGRHSFSIGLVKLCANRKDEETQVGPESISEVQEVDYKLVQMLEVAPVRSLRGKHLIPGVNWI